MRRRWPPCRRCGSEQDPRFHSCTPTVDGRLDEHLPQPMILDPEHCTCGRPLDHPLHVLILTADELLAEHGIAPPPTEPKEGP